jgi:hypothetical protein
MTVSPAAFRAGRRDPREFGVTNRGAIRRSGGGGRTPGGAVRTVLPIPILLVLLASSAAGQSGVQAGAGYSSGILGLEVSHALERWPVEVAAGAGIAGVGARLLLAGSAVRPGGDGPPLQRYLSAGYLLTPWAFGNVDAVGAFGAKGGARILLAGTPVYADLAAGVVIPHGGTLGGSTLGPALRLQIGLRQGAPAHRGSDF